VVKPGACPETIRLAYEGVEGLELEAGGGLLIKTAAGVLADNVSNQTLAPGQEATLTVRFAPAAAGPYSDSFDIPSNDPDENPVTVNLSGNGIVAPDLTGSFTMLRSYAWGRAVMAKVLIQNTGNAASGSFKIAFYLSDDASFDPGADQFLWSRNVLGIGPERAQPPAFSTNSATPFPASTCLSSSMQPTRWRN